MFQDGYIRINYSQTKDGIIQLWFEISFNTNMHKKYRYGWYDQENIDFADKTETKMHGIANLKPKTYIRYRYHIPIPISQTMYWII